MLPSIKLDWFGGQPSHLLYKPSINVPFGVRMDVIQSIDMDYSWMRTVSVCIRRKIGEVRHVPEIINGLKAS